jgi:hypothetical protein
MKLRWFEIMMLAASVVVIALISLFVAAAFCTYFPDGGR